MADQRPPKSWLKAFGSLSFNQKITATLALSSMVLALGSLLIGGVSTYVAYQSYRVASDSSDIKAAIRNLSSVATQSRRQADASARQLTEMQKQTNNLASQATAAQGQLKMIKAQTTAISEQTAAMKETAAAAVQSANAQADSARTSERAQLPHVALESMSIDGLASEPDAQGAVKLTLNVLFRNTGGGAFTQKLSLLAVSFEKALPPKPNFVTTPGFPRLVLPWGGNDYSVAPGRDLKPVNAPQFLIDKSLRDDVLANRVSSFVYGTIEYEDSLGRHHSHCFAYRLVPEPDSGTLSHPFPAGGEAYRCDT